MSGKWNGINQEMGELVLRLYQMDANSYRCNSCSFVTESGIQFVKHVYKDTHCKQSALKPCIACGQYGTVPKSPCLLVTEIIKFIVRKASEAIELRRNVDKLEPTSRLELRPASEPSVNERSEEDLKPSHDDIPAPNVSQAGHASGDVIAPIVIEPEYIPTVENVEVLNKHSREKDSNSCEVINTVRAISDTEIADTEINKINANDTSEDLTVTSVIVSNNISQAPNTAYRLRSPCDLGDSNVINNASSSTNIEEHGEGRINKVGNYQPDVNSQPLLEQKALIVTQNKAVTSEVNSQPLIEEQAQLTTQNKTVSFNINSESLSADKTQMATQNKVVSLQEHFQPLPEETSICTQNRAVLSSNNSRKSNEFYQNCKKKVRLTFIKVDETDSEEADESISNFFMSHKEEFLFPIGKDHLLLQKSNECLLCHNCRYRTSSSQNFKKHVFYHLHTKKNDCHHFPDVLSDAFRHCAQTNFVMEKLSSCTCSTTQNKTTCVMHDYKDEFTDNCITAVCFNMINMKDFKSRAEVNFANYSMDILEEANSSMMSIQSMATSSEDRNASIPMQSMEHEDKNKASQKTSEDRNVSIPNMENEERSMGTQSMATEDSNMLITTMESEEKNLTNQSKSDKEVVSSLTCQYAFEIVDNEIILREVGNVTGETAEPEIATLQNEDDITKDPDLSRNLEELFQEFKKCNEDAEKQREEGKKIYASSVMSVVTRLFYENQ